MFGCGPLGDGGHGHYDSLGVEAYGHGHPLVVDPGRYTYAEGDAQLAPLVQGDRRAQHRDRGRPGPAAVPARQAEGCADDQPAAGPARDRRPAPAARRGHQPGVRRGAPAGGRLRRRRVLAGLRPAARRPAARLRAALAPGRRPRPGRPAHPGGALGHHDQDGPPRDRRRLARHDRAGLGLGRVRREDRGAGRGGARAGRDRRGAGDPPGAPAGRHGTAALLGGRIPGAAVVELPDGRHRPPPSGVHRTGRSSSTGSAPRPRRCGSGPTGTAHRSGSRSNGPRWCSGRRARGAAPADPRGRVAPVAAGGAS